jgi:hypothetical protein
MGQLSYETDRNGDYMKTKKAVGGRFGALGFLAFFSFFAFGSDAFAFLLLAENTWIKEYLSNLKAISPISKKHKKMF